MQGKTLASELTYKISPRTEKFLLFKEQTKVENGYSCD